jgi:2-oxoglutarate ferredoxin oxidoreductase subunit gamma
MEKKTPNKASMIVAGIGGKGALTLGQVLAEVGLSKYGHASYFPVYIGLQRGFPCHATVVLSNEKVISTALYRTDAVIVLEAMQVPEFVDRVKPGGLLIVENAGLAGPVTRDGIRVIEVPGIEMAIQLGSSLAANYVLFGAYVASSKVLPVEAFADEIVARYASRPKVGELNRAAFEEGAEFFLKMGS